MYHKLTKDSSDKEWSTQKRVFIIPQGGKYGLSKPPHRSKSLTSPFETDE